MGRPLITNDCQGKCDWLPTDDQIEGRPVFECVACRSEWTTAQSWTPRNADGDVSDAVAEARAANPA